MGLKQVRSGIASAKPARLAFQEKKADPFYLSAAFKAWAIAVKTRDEFKCRGAGPHNGPLIADHIHERRDGGAELDVANGMTLCAACHSRKTAEARRLRSI